MADSMNSACEMCVNYSYDAQYDEYFCCVNMDEDEVLRLFSDSKYNCPYFRLGDDYTIVKKQI